MVLAGLIAAGCAFDPVSACLGNCRNGQAGGCVAASTDCAVICEDAEAEYEAARAEAAAVGCGAEYDVAISCKLGAPDACDPTTCGAEVDSYLACRM